MKKLYIIVTFAAYMLVVTSVHSQVSHTGNNRVSGDLVGYDGIAGIAGPLEVRNDFSSNKPIDFYINNVNFLSIITGTNLGDVSVVQPTNAYEIF